MLIPLRELFAHAVDDGLLSANPAARIPIPTERRRKIVPPTAEQVGTLMNAARAEAVDALTIAASLGLRRGELFALRWRDVDFEQRLVRVHATNDHGTIIETTKTEAGERSVPLFESARKVLMQRKLAARFSTPDDLVFGSAVGTPMEPGNFQRREFLTAQQKAGLGSGCRRRERSAVGSVRSAPTTCGITRCRH